MDIWAFLPDGETCVQEVALLAALSISASLFLRMGIINIALDTFVVLGSGAYALSMDQGMRPGIGMLVSFAAVLLFSVSLIIAKLRLRMDDLSLSVGVYFVIFGL